MVKVITYGTFDCFHYGHIRLLERAKGLGDYLVVGITSDDFDISRGKINVRQSLIERAAAVKESGLADQIIVEEYEGQKIDDICRYNINIFTAGSDWIGKFDYLKDYCKVVYLDRTQGISSSDIRSKSSMVRIGLAGDIEDRILEKYYNECSFVNGAEVSGICIERGTCTNRKYGSVPAYEYRELLQESDAIYLISHPSLHYAQIKEAILAGRHVLCESPIVLNVQELEELTALAKSCNVILMEAIKTAYSTAYSRMLLLLKCGRIGRVVSVDSTCTSLQPLERDERGYCPWNSISSWGPTALLPVFQILGTDYEEVRMSSLFFDEEHKQDSFTKVEFGYESSVASIKVGKGVKSEGELIISGTAGYLYVPAPWWKTDYFELRYEDPSNNKRYFYQLDGEGIRYELVAFLNAIRKGRGSQYISFEVSKAIADVMARYYRGESKNLNRRKSIYGHEKL